MDRSTTTNCSKASSHFPLELFQPNSKIMSMTEIMSTESIKPSSPTPDHLKSYKLSLLDQFSPPTYVPVTLFYAPKDLDHSTMFTRLKNSLSKTLTRFYPLGGMIKDGVSVDLSYEAVSFTEARADIQLSDILRNPKMDILQQFLPFDPYNMRSEKPVVVMAIQATILGCGGLGIGVCISHIIADGATLASFLSVWAATARGDVGTIADPLFDMAIVFPPSDHLRAAMPTGLFSKQKIVTKRFVFDATSLDILKARASRDSCIKNPTRVEAVTALICKSAMDSTSGKSGKAKQYSRIITHVVNLRERMVPKLPGHAFGNLWRNAITPVTADDKKIQLPDIVVQLRAAIRKINEEYVRKLQGDDGLSAAIDSVKEVSEMVATGEVEFYRFSSWVRFPFYQTDFGWGKPMWVCTSSSPIKNVVVLMSTRSGDGIEAWVSMDEEDMTMFESEKQLLQYALLPEQPYSM